MENTASVTSVFAKMAAAASCTPWKYNMVQGKPRGGVNRFGTGNRKTGKYKKGQGRMGENWYLYEYCRLAVIWYNSVWYISWL